MESANSGRMINSDAFPAIAADNQKYTLSIVENTLTTETTSIAPGTLTTTHDLVTPATLNFTGTGTAGTEWTGDVIINVDDERPEATGVYSDTITFTIMDDG